MLIPTELPALIESLRQEAADARSGFHTLTVQVIAFAVAAVSAILIAGDKAPEAAFATLAVFGVVIAVQRIGIHQFSTANRLYGYQLRLERLGNPRHPLALIGWEEACRAWRIVQATVFQQVYVTPPPFLARWPPVADLLPYYFLKGNLRKKLKEVSDALDLIDKCGSSGASRAFATGQHRRRVSVQRGEWYRRLLDSAAESPLPAGPNEPSPAQKTPEGTSGKHNEPAGAEALVEGASKYWWMQNFRAELGGGYYHAGSYLERMFSTLALLQLFSLLPLLVLFVGRWQTLWRAGHAAWVCGLVGVVLWFLNRLALQNRRDVLENEFLSIHSCAIMWKAVALAHRCAWGQSAKGISI